jgi:ankyrin repeat protein
MFARPVLLSLVLTALVTAGCGGGKPQAPPDASSTEVQEFHAALQDGDAEIIRRLVAAKPYLVNARNKEGVSPLQAAQRQNNEEVADLLRQKGAKE